MPVYEVLADEGVVRGQVTGEQYDYSEHDTVEAPEGEFAHTESVSERDEKTDE